MRSMIFSSRDLDAWRSFVKEERRVEKADRPVGMITRNGYHMLRDGDKITQGEDERYQVQPAWR